MTDIESRLADALRASVADATPGFDVVAAVRRRHRRQLIRVATASAAAVAALGTAAAALGVPGGSAPRAGLARGIAASAVASVPCAAATAKPTGALPDAFTPVAVIRCVQEERVIPGHGLWRFEVKQQADHGLAAFIADLRVPSTRAPQACLYFIYGHSPFALVDRHGQVLRPTLPTDGCGTFPAAITDLQHLPWVTVSVRRTVQLATRTELQAACERQWKNVVQLESGSRLMRPSACGSP